MLLHAQRALIYLTKVVWQTHTCTHELYVPRWPPLVLPGYHREHTCPPPPPNMFVCKKFLKYQQLTTAAAVKYIITCYRRAVTPGWAFLFVCHVVTRRAPTITAAAATCVDSSDLSLGIIITRGFPYLEVLRCTSRNSSSSSNNSGSILAFWHTLFAMNTSHQIFSNGNWQFIVVLTHTFSSKSENKVLK